MRVASPMAARELISTILPLPQLFKRGQAGLCQGDGSAEMDAGEHLQVGHVHRTQQGRANHPGIVDDVGDSVLGGYARGHRLRRRGVREVCGVIVQLRVFQG